MTVDRPSGRVDELSTNAGGARGGRLLERTGVSQPRRLRLHDPSGGGDRDSSRDEAELQWISLLAIAAAVVRVAWLLEQSAFPWWDFPPSDSAVYEAVALQVFASGAGDLRLPLMSPGYFLLVALSYATFGSSPWALRLLQSALGVATVIATWRLARLLVAPRLALLASGLVAFGGTCVFFDGAVLPESPATALQVFVVWSLVAAVREPFERRRMQRFAMTGALLGALSLFRPNALLEAIVVVGLGASGKARAGVRASAALASLATTMMVSAPVWMPVATGRGLSVSGPASFNLFIGNGPGATGAFRVPPEAPGADSPLTQLQAFRVAAERALGRALDDAAVDAYWRQRTFEHVAAHPDLAVGLMARKFRLFFNARELGSVFPYEFARQASRTLRPLVQTGWIAPFALVGMVLGLARRIEEPALFAVGSTTLAFVASVVAAFVTDRFRAPAFPLFAVLTVAAVERGVAIARRDRRAGAMLGLAVALSGSLAWPVGDRSTTASLWVELGNQWAALGDVERAAEAYREALARDPTRRDARDALRDLDRRETHRR